MKPMVKLIGAVLLAGVTGSTHVHSAGDPSRGPIPFSSFDRDGNGSINEEEFYAVRGERMAARAAEGRMLRRAAQAPGFTDVDLNGDQAISREEFAEHQATRCTRRWR